MLGGPRMVVVALGNDWHLQGLLMLPPKPFLNSNYYIHLHFYRLQSSQQK